MAQRAARGSGVVVLVTGMSGTGKTTVLDELVRRGHRAVDTDAPGWLVDVHTPYGPEPMWDAARITALLDGHCEGTLFVAGCVANQGTFYERFDAIVLLSAPVDVVLTRVADRANPFGSSTQDRAKIVSDVAAFEPRLRAGAHLEIVTTVPVSDVADQLEALVASRRGTDVVGVDAPQPCDAGPMVFNMNVGGGQSIFAQASTRVTELDAELRDKHTGKPADDIKPHAILALRRIGVSLSDAELVAYATAISRGEKYQFHLS